MLLGGPWRNEFIAPGPLTAHHAQLIEGQTLGCSQCHAAADGTLAAWWGHSTDGASTIPAQSVLCLECHREMVTPELAMAAHSVELTALGAGGGGAPARLADRLRDPREPIACAACHREHQGLHHNLAAITDDACQACHKQQYESFAGDHPDFGSWPYERRTRIVFDHASHQAKHFPTEKRQFACAACHQSDGSGERQLTLHYETACAACHDKSIVASLADGVPLVELPTLDVDALARAGHSITPWPEEATGDFDGLPPTAAKLLLAADPQGERALGVLGPQVDLFDIDATDATQLAAVADLAIATRSLIEDLAKRGHAAVVERLQTLLGREVKSAELEALAGRLSPDVVRSYRDRWFSEPPTAASTGEDRIALLESVAAGGWVRDDRTFSLRYRPTGHADPWLRAWLDVLAEAASGPQRELADPLLRASLQPAAPGQCGHCHSLRRDAAGRLAIQWRAFQPEEESRGFTRFDHRPHLLSHADDCTSCHRIGEATQLTDAHPVRPSEVFTAGFEPMIKASCSGCHTPTIAGDSCTQCHRYHGSGP